MVRRVRKKWQSWAQHPQRLTLHAHIPRGGEPALCRAMRLPSSQPSEFCPLSLASPPAGAFLPSGFPDRFLFWSPSKTESPETFNLALPHCVCFISSPWLATIWGDELELLFLPNQPTYSPSHFLRSHSNSGKDQGLDLNCFSGSHC